MPTSSPWQQPDPDLPIATEVWRASQGPGDATEPVLRALFDGLVALEREVRGAAPDDVDPEAQDPSDPLSMG